jgi:ribonuclease-3
MSKEAFELMDLALTHSSWVAEHGGQHNERLEFLGDAVLKLLTAEYLYVRRPAKGEGSLSQMLHQLVQNPNLASLARSLDLGAALKLGRGEEKSGGRERESILADSFEAMLAVVYLADGLEAARGVVEHHFNGALPRIERTRHPISELQEWTQEAFQTLPTYTCVDKSGPDHAPTFSYRVSLGERELAVGSGMSKAAAKTAAAREALEARSSERLDT